MANKFQKFLYNFSAASPICFLFSVVWAIQKGTWQVPSIFSTIGILAIIGFYMSFEYGIKHMAPIPIRTTEISPKDGWIAVYIITYLLPFTSLVINNINVWTFGLTAFAIAALAPFSNTAIPNPLLAVRHYHFYQVSSEHGISGYILISKNKFRNKQEPKIVNRMFDFLLIDAERK